MNYKVIIATILVFNSVEGRKFIVKGRSRTTFSQTCNLDTGKYAGGWKMGQPPIISPNNTYNQEIGRFWLEQAELSHAALASFARNTLYLMSLGSPPGLLVTSQEAGIDKIKHAKLFFGFASAFIGTELAPGPLNVEGCLDETDIRFITQSLIKEGCIGETIGAMEVRFRAHHAEDPAIKAALTQVALDETNHAQYAWETLEWIVEKYPDIYGYVMETFRIELEGHLQNIECREQRTDLPTTCSNSCTDSDESKMFRQYGLLVDEDRDRIRESGIRDIIEPIYRNGLKDVKMISEKISKLDEAENRQSVSKKDEL